MAQTQEVIQERSSGVTPSGERVTHQRVQVSSDENEKQIVVWTFTRLVFYLVGVLETLLVFRFTLKILGANPFSPFVSFIYNLSSIFTMPFRGIFSSAVAEGIETTSVFEPATLFAILVYLVIAIGITELVKVLTVAR